MCHSILRVTVFYEKIDKTTEVFYSVYREDHMKKIVNAIAQDKDAPDVPQEKLEKYKEGEIPVEFDIAQLISNAEYEPSHEVEELIKDSEHYEKERNFRRIDKWQ